MLFLTRNRGEKCETKCIVSFKKVSPLLLWVFKEQVHRKHRWERQNLFQHFLTENQGEKCKTKPLVSFKRTSPLMHGHFQAKPVVKKLEMVFSPGKRQWIVWIMSDEKWCKTGNVDCKLSTIFRKFLLHIFDRKIGLCSRCKTWNVHSSYSVVCRPSRWTKMGCKTWRLIV